MQLATQQPFNPSDAAPLHLETRGVRFRRIVVGVDFSDASERALKTAAKIAKTFGSKVFVAHAASLPTATIGVETLLPAVMDETLEASRAELKNYLSEDEEIRHLHADMFVTFDSAVDFILRTAEENNADLIALGTHCPRRLERFFLGSVAEAVLRLAKCPVLIVGPESRFVEHPFRSILFATDLTDTGLRAAQLSSALAIETAARFHLLHVMNSKETTADMKRQWTEENVRHHLKELTPADLRKQCDISAIVSYGDPAEEIVAAADAQAASLIVVGTGRHREGSDHLPWSTLSQVLRMAHCPVLSVSASL